MYNNIASVGVNDRRRGRGERGAISAVRCPRLSIVSFVVHYSFMVIPIVVQLLQATCGVSPGVPEAVLNVLSSQACHGEIP